LALTLLLQLEEAKMGLRIVSSRINRSKSGKKESTEGKNERL